MGIACGQIFVCVKINIFINFMYNIIMKNSEAVISSSSRLHEYA